MTPEEFRQAMNYESPIQIIYGEMQTKLENDIIGAVNAVLPYDIQINKEELIKALQNDRKQYERGWEDARRAFQQGYWRDSLKEAFREHASISGDMFHLSEIERIIDGEPVNELPEESDNAPTVEHICPYLSDGEVKQPCIQAPCERPKGEWIPIKFRPLTEEEKECYPEEADGIYDCRLPDDGEEVLITTRWGAVCIDTFHRDEEDQSYFEDHDDADDVSAWKPLPKPYKEETPE